MDKYIINEKITGWETFFENDLNFKLNTDDFININNEELKIERVIHELDGSIIYKTSKILNCQELY